MSKYDSKICPKCKTTAKDKKEIVRVFGLRRMGKDSKGKEIIRSQSYCKVCRGKGAKSVKRKATKAHTKGSRRSVKKAKPRTPRPQKNP